MKQQKKSPIMVTHALRYVNRFGKKTHAQTFKTKHAFGTRSLEKFKVAVRALKKTKPEIVLPRTNRSTMSLFYVFPDESYVELALVSNAGR